MQLNEPSHTVPLNWGFLRRLSNICFDSENQGNVCGLSIRGLGMGLFIGAGGGTWEV